MIHLLGTYSSKALHQDSGGALHGEDKGSRGVVVGVGGASSGENDDRATEKRERAIVLA